MSAIEWITLALVGAMCVLCLPVGLIALAVTLLLMKWGRS